ncbi:MAG: biotin transporter BioY [Hyphomicrobiales bacterium]
MSFPSAQALTNVLSPAYLQKRSLAWQATAVVVGSLFLTISSYIEVPMVPVPINMQTFAVSLVGALYGWRVGAVTIVAWLLEGAAGLPVLSGGAGGYIHFIGPTAGYLFAFPIMGVIIGALCERGWNGDRVFLAFIAMMIGGTVCLALGAVWLALTIGFEKAIAYGVAPFLVGDVLKAALGAATLKGLAVIRGRLSAS